jgi:hypothetical protein
MTDIVAVTKAKGREFRLEWDVAKLPHHCSYLSLGPDKGTDKTEPVENVKWLYEEQRQDGGIIVSTSKPIPTKGTKEDEDQNPPHRQPANYYKGDVVDNAGAQFLVTMEQPSITAPKPIVIEIDASKATVQKRAVSAAYIATSRPAPRAG